MPASGAEDVEAFRIGGELFLAVANLRTGQGPYDLNVDSVLYRWSGSSFVVHQRIPTFAAKQWHYFTVGGRHFLALAQGVDGASAAPRNPSRSAIFEWDGQLFRSFQEIDSIWGYNWLYFQAAGEHLLAYADHKAPSRFRPRRGSTRPRRPAARR